MDSSEGNSSLPIEFGPVTKENIAELKKLNAAALPAVYDAAFYKSIIACDNDLLLSKFAYYNGRIVGAICTRIDDSDHSLYIQTLAVSAVYRGRGIGSKLLESVMETYKSISSAGNSSDILQVNLHVQVSNTDAIQFYTVRHGFVKGEIVHNYYNRRIDPPHCYKLYKTLYLTE